MYFDQDLYYIRCTEGQIELTLQQYQFLKELEKFEPQILFINCV